MRIRKIKYINIYKMPKAKRMNEIYLKKTDNKIIKMAYQKKKRL